MVWMRHNEVMKLPMIPLSFTHQSIAYIRSPYALRFSQKLLSRLANRRKSQVKRTQLSLESAHLKALSI